jgi:hypothetical protein
VYVPANAGLKAPATHHKKKHKKHKKHPERHRRRHR